MTGSVMEWMRDSGQGFASQCWYAASVVDPVCDEDNALVRSVRGNAWTTLANSLGLRQGSPPREPDVGLGLRCVYAP
jgi:hypothetical protein